MRPIGQRRAMRLGVALSRREPPDEAMAFYLVRDILFCAVIPVCIWLSLP